MNKYKKVHSGIEKISIIFLQCNKKKYTPAIEKKNGRPPLFAASEGGLPPILKPLGGCRDHTYFNLNIPPDGDR